MENSLLGVLQRGESYASAPPDLKAPKFYMPQLDVMRFFAFLSVFQLHTLPGVDVGSHVGRYHTLALAAVTLERIGEKGVELFFVLSAYLITELLLRERRATGEINLLMFYARRILRIWPLYFFILLIGLLMQPLAPAFHLSAKVIASYVFFVNNWQIALHGFTWNPIFPLWTISAEEQFYFIWPFAMRRLSLKTIKIACVAIVLVLPFLVYRSHGLWWNLGSTTPVSLLLFFPLGGLLALTLRRERKQISVAKAGAAILLGVGLWFLGHLYSQPDGVTYASVSRALMGRAIGALGTVIIFLAFLYSEAEAWPRSLVYLGKISFGLYVYHRIVGAIVGMLAVKWGLGLRTGANHSLSNVLISLCVVAPITLLCTIAVSALSYHFLEVPFLRIKERFAVIPSRAT